MEQEFLQQELKKPVSLFSLLPQEVKKPKSLFDSFLDEAHEICNKSLMSYGRRPRSKAFYASAIRSHCKDKFGNIDETTMHYFQQQCKRGIYSKVFFGIVKK